MIESRSKASKTIRCSICNEIISDLEDLYQCPETRKTICSGCIQKFSPEDIELLPQIFNAFGGYFGKEKEENPIPLSQLIEETIEEIEKKGRFDLGQVQITVIHKALLLGYTPREFQEYLEKMLNKY